MRYITAVFVALTLSISPLQANTESIPPPGEVTQHNSLQRRMFDGIHFTESQRQQMRDLMQQTQQDAPVVSISDLEKIHRLLIANDFDEDALRALAEKIARRQVNRQVEMAKIRNRMYHTLTPEQRAVVEKNYQQHLEKLQQAGKMQ